MPIASLTTFKPQLNLSNKNSLLTRFPWITTNKRNKKKMQTTKCTSFGQEKFRLIMALAQSIKKYWNSILPGPMWTSDTADYFENLADGRKDERPVDLLLRKYGTRTWRHYCWSRTCTTERSNPKRKLTCKIKNKRNKKGLY